MELQYCRVVKADSLLQQVLCLVFYTLSYLTATQLIMQEFIYTGCV